jgi:general secretion pathway protein A
MNEDRQYLQYFTLTAKPFYDLRDPRFVWLGEKQLETLSRLRNGVEQRKGISLLTGVAGTGKSVLVDQFMRSLPKGTITVLLREAGLKVERYRQLIAEQLALPQAETKGDFLFALKEFLDSAYRNGRYVVVVAEDLDRAEDEVLEQVRLMSNLETPDQEKLIHILITGNRSLEERLATYEHRALQQRVEVRRTVEPLSITETAAYIRHRMMIAGAFLEIFAAEAVERIHRFSGGLPKPIDIICEHALKRACGDRKRNVDGGMIDIYLREIRASSRIGLDLTGEESCSKLNLRILPMLTAGIVFLLVASLYLPRGELKPLPEQTIAQVAPPPAFSLQFEPRSAAISGDDFPKLDAVAKFLIANPGSRVIVTAPAASVGASGYAKRMAGDRPEAVKTYLASKGVGVERIRTEASPTGWTSAGVQGAGGKDRSVQVEIALQP